MTAAGTRSDPGRLSVAVIIPVFNGAAYVGGALTSVVAQTLQPTQVIVVDDGSTDDSCIVVATVSCASRIQLVRRQNGGQSAARNTGLAHVTADVVAFLDQDDVWSPDHLAVLMKRLEDDPTAAWAYSDFDEIDGDGLLVLRGFHRQHHLRHPKTSMAEMLGADLMVLPSASIVRTTALRDVGGFDESLCGYEDDDLFIRLFRNHSLPSYTSRSTVQFRIHANSSSVANTFVESRLRFLDKLVAEVPDNRRLSRYYVRDLVVPRLLRTSISEYLNCLMHGDRERALQLALVTTQIAERTHVAPRRRLGLWAMRHPRLCRRALVLRSLLPQSLRQRLLRGIAFRNYVPPISR